MSRFEVWAVHVSSVLVVATGLVYGWMRYFAVPADPYAVVGHPWQPQLQHLHVLVAPLLVFAAGLIWREHVWKHWRRGVRRRRRSGVAMMLTVVPMVASGYLLQTAVSEAWRQTWVAVHVATSLLWLAAYAGHLAVPWLLRQRSPAAAEVADGGGPAARPS